MSDLRYVFIGNRSFVLDFMRRSGLKVRALAVQGSYVEKYLVARNEPYVSISSKSHLVEVLGRSEFEILVSNGCPHILPVGKLSQNGQQLVNVHPSPLPDLRGADPVPGAILFGRNSGASCHLMDEGIDTGPLISRVVVPMSDRLDARLLYQMSFLAEVEAFEIALGRSFRPDTSLNLVPDFPEPIYYTKKDTDQYIDLKESTTKVVNRVRAFANLSQGALLAREEGTLRIYQAEIVDHPYLLKRIANYEHKEVVFQVEDMLLIRHWNSFLQFSRIVGDLSFLNSGQVLD